MRLRSAKAVQNASRIIADAGIHQSQQFKKPRALIPATEALDTVDSNLSLLAHGHGTYFGLF